MEISEHTFESARHRTFYLVSGLEDGPLLVFVHGWPELSLSWRHQLPHFGALGYRVIAPDMRGYGRSSVPDSHEAYALEPIVEDMIELLDHLGGERAVWVGHDWGAAVVWALAAHHPERAGAVANLCLPYGFGMDGLDGLVTSVDRSVYPEDEYPAGQWDYIFHYQENFAGSIAEMEVNPYNTIVALFRAGGPAGEGQPAITSALRRDGGWFPGMNGAPEMPLDETVLTEADARAYAAALEKNGFFGPGSYYMNFDLNVAYAARSKNGGRLHMPVLFIHGAYDFVCETLASRLAEPMREYCTDLNEAVVKSGHWMAQEKPDDVNRELEQWLEQMSDNGGQ
jgi:pimeloyl-ACP methyl ester carboxylesterase